MPYPKQAIGRISSETINNKTNGGRKKIMTPTKLRNGINKYFAQCEQTGRTPSQKGLMIFLKCRPDYFRRFLSYPELTSILEQAKLIIEEWCENDIYTTDKPTGGKIAYMKNVHGWRDKTETTSEVKQVISIDEAKARIEMLAPKLLEILKASGALPQNIAIPAPQEAIEAVYEENTTKDVDDEPKELTDDFPFEIETTPRRVVR